MPQILASGKTGNEKYEALNADKNLPDLDLKQIAQSCQKLYQMTQGYSYSGDEGSSDAIDDDLSIITDANSATYSSDLATAVQTLVANNSRLVVDGTTTANSIVLTAPTIPTGTSPNGSSYLTAAPLPFKWEDDLTFTFRATITNTNAVVVQIPGLSGLSGSIAAVDENGSALTGGEIIAGRFYEIITTTVSSTKKVILKKRNEDSYVFATTTQFFTSGSGTWTKPSGCTSILVKFLGAGGGGGGSAATPSAGSNGGSTAFNSITANGGTGGTASSTGGAGGTGGSGTATRRVNGFFGKTAYRSGTGSDTQWVGYGADSFMGYGQGGDSVPNSSGGAAQGFGSGGSGATQNTYPAGNGGGGGSGEYVELLISSPSATYTYTVGTGGAGGSGTGGVVFTGGAGGNGIIEVHEYY